MLLEAVPWHAEPDLLVNIYSARQKWFDSPGVGKDVRIEGVLRQMQIDAGFCSLLSKETATSLGGNVRATNKPQNGSAS